MTLSNKTYDILKWIALYLLPALGTLYFTLSGLWGLPYGEQVVGTITALDTFIAVLIGISSYGYKGDGTMLIDQSNPALDTYLFKMDRTPDEMRTKKTITLRVDPNATIDPGMVMTQDELVDALS